MNGNGVMAINYYDHSYAKKNNNKINDVWHKYCTYTKYALVEV